MQKELTETKSRGVMGFAYFLAKNRPIFFENGELLIKTTRAHVCTKRGRTETREDRSDYSKLASFKNKWNKMGDQLCIASTGSANYVALVLNELFWKNRAKKSRIWRPELTM